MRGQGQADDQHVEVLREEGVQVGWAGAGVPRCRERAVWVAEVRELVAFVGARGGRRAGRRRVRADGAAEGGEDAGNFLDGQDCRLVFFGEVGSRLMTLKGVNGVVDYLPCLPILPYPAIPTFFPTQSAGTGKSRFDSPHLCFFCSSYILL